MEEVTYVEWIEDARRKIGLVKTNPSASDTERLLADSLSNVIKAFEDYILTPRCYGNF